jgi:Ca2+-binding RTX toxin-like protein
LNNLGGFDAVGLGGKDTLNGFGGPDTLEGGAGDDTYKFRSNWGADTVVEGASGGTDMLDFSAIGGSLTITMSAASVLTVTHGAGNSVSGSNLEKVVGGTGEDTLDRSAVTGALNFRVTSTGDVVITGGIALTVSNVENFKGGSADDVFVFEKGGKVSGSIDGGGGTKLLSFSVNTVNPDTSTGGYDTSVSIALPATTVGGTDGKATGIDGFAAGGIKNMSSIIGGRGDDTLRGGAYASTMVGGRGDDTLTGGDGVERLEGGEDDDRLFGNAGGDTLIGGHGDDLLEGGAGSDTLRGDGATGTLSDSDDILAGGLGNDTLVGGKGNDAYRFANLWGQDTIEETAGNGKDTVDFSAVTADLNFTINSGGLMIATSGVAPAQTVNGAESIEVTKGGQGVNTYTFAAVWANEIHIENDAGGVPTAILDLSAVTAGLTIVIDENPADALGNIVTITGGSFKIVAKNIASIVGGGGTNRIVIEDDATLVGDLDGGSGGANTLEYRGGAAVDVTVLSNVDRVTGTVTNIVHITGGDGDDDIEGSSGANVLRGGDGNDEIDGMGGEDSLYGVRGAGADADGRVDGRHGGEHRDT